MKPFAATTKRKRASPQARTSWKACRKKKGTSERKNYKKARVKLCLGGVEAGKGGVSQVLNLILKKIVGGPAESDRRRDSEKGGRSEITQIE